MVKGSIIHFKKKSCITGLNLNAQGENKNEPPSSYQITA